MSRRHDLVLAAIPTLALSGPIITAGAKALESAVGVGGAIAQFPLTVAGLLGSLAVIGQALARDPAAE